MNVTGVILALVALVVVAVIGYRAGYLRGRAELLLQVLPTEAEWNDLRMNSVLPRWRRVAGWAAYVFSGLLLCLFLALAYRYAKGWGGAFCWRLGFSSSPSSWGLCMIAAIYARKISDQAERRRERNPVRRRSTRP